MTHAIRGASGRFAVASHPSDNKTAARKQRPARRSARSGIRAAAAPPKSRGREQGAREKERRARRGWTKRPNEEVEQGGTRRRAVLQRGNNGSGRPNRSLGNYSGNRRRTLRGGAIVQRLLYNSPRT